MNVINFLSQYYDLSLNLDNYDRGDLAAIVAVPAVLLGARRHPPALLHHALCLFKGRRSNKVQFKYFLDEENLYH